MSTLFLTRLLRLIALCLFAAVAARADDNAVHLTEDQKKALVDGLQWQTGTITLDNGLAKIALKDGFRFLGAADARKVLHQLWQNPDDPDVLGLLFPKDQGPLTDGGYAVTVEYENNGYVKDNDADKINYDDLLKNMKQAVHDANDERVKQGYQPMELVGWAQAPRYDKDTHKLYWAKQFKVGNEPEDILNYDIRILGRHGTLVLTVLGDMNALPEINTDVPGLLSMVDFQPGNTYAEFDPKIDKVAEYGLAGLIAGGALAGAAKLGLFGLAFKWIIAAVLALKKALILVVVAIVAGVKKLWSKITGQSKTPDNLLPPR
ncbi:MAG TPA: DUF2167 domain-containing protein [Candidatus Methylacidiphilales bacterium]|nr:DUF2167 domain-containing protein [Candidatus Methylacidiphilales bacterium]